MKRIAYILSVCSLFSLAGCNNTVNHPELNSATEFNTGYAFFYGAYYAEDGIDRNVVVLDLYSPKLGLDSLGVIRGTGTNFYLSDIFLLPKDTLLPATTYKSDTTAAPLTFLPGMNYEGNVSGAYLLDIVDSQISRITLLTEGGFTLRYKGDSAIININMKTDGGKAYAAEFRGTLPMYDRRQTVPSDTETQPKAAKGKHLPKRR